MPTRDPTPLDQTARLSRLNRAMDAWLTFCAGPQDADRGEFLRRHADLRDLLEPMFEDQDGTADRGDDARPRTLGPGQMLGDYLLRREIGRGGMGVVYEAEQRSLRRRVALKVLSAHLTLSPQAIARFRHEAAAAARLQHPAIVPIHEVGECDGCHFFSMEFVAGRPLHELVHRDRFGVRNDCSRAAEAAELVARLADALQHAHDHGLVHRDVKPHNVMVGHDGSVRLLDFGLAKELSAASRSATVDFLGTPHYCSPEQITGATRIGPSSDVFALGIVLYELLARRRPFDGETDRIVLRNIEVGAFPPLRHVAPDVPRDLQTICHKALGPRPQDRYASAGAFAADLRRFLRLEPIHAVPPGPVARTVKWLRRHRLGVALGSTLAVALVGAPIAYAWHLHHHRDTILRERAILDRAEDLGFQGIEQTLGLLREQLDLLPEPGEAHAARLATVMRLCDSFLAMRQDDPRRQARVAMALHEIAGIHTQLHQLDAAAAACARAKAMLIGTERTAAFALQLGRIRQRELQIRQLAEPSGGDAEFAAAMDHWHTVHAEGHADVELRHECAATLLMRARALANRPDRRREAEPLLQRIGEVLAGSGDDDVRARTLLARRDAVRGQILLASHRTDAALELLRAVAATMAVLPADPVLGAERAVVDAAIGTALHRRQRADEAGELLQATLASTTAQLRQYPGSTLLRRAQRSTRLVLADHLMVTGKVPAAMTMLRQAVAAESQRSPSGPAELEDQEALAQLDRQLATCLLLGEDPADVPEATRLLQSACDRMEDLVAEQPAHFEFRSELGYVHHHLATLANEQGDHLAAVDHAERASEQQRLVLAAVPTDRRARALLGSHQAQLAHALARLGRAADAVAAAIQTVSSAPNELTTMRLAARAAARATALAAGEPDLTDEQRTAAAESRGKVAVDALRQILRLDRDEARRLLADRGFQVLAGRADFRALCQQVDTQ